MVTSKLFKDFDLHLSDCLDHPIALKRILCELFGNSYNDILKSIDESLKEITMNDKMTHFVNVLRN